MRQTKVKEVMAKLKNSGGDKLLSRLTVTTS